jgi:glycosyltransferase involved in cell wall biosynthesis
MRGLVEQGHAHVRALLREVDHVVAVCEWVRALLLRLGVPPGRVTLNRQGLSEAPERQAEPRPDPAGRPLRLAFLGRLDATKGLDVVLQALQRIPRVPLTLDAYVVRQGEGSAYEREVERLAAADPRVSLRSPVASAEVVPALRAYDALVVPSQWLETGPLVVLEAFAAGTPVIGSDLGGVAELVTEGVDGLLVPASDLRAWAGRLQRIAAGPALLGPLRQGIRPPRTMRAVAEEMAGLYQGVLSRVPAPLPAAHASA